MPDKTLTQTKPQFARIRENPNQRVPQNLWLLLLIFWTAILCSILAEAVVSMGIGILAAVIGAAQSSDPTLGLLRMLGLTGVTVVLILVYCRCIERRPFRTMGLTLHRLLPDYLLGFLLGLAMFSAIVLLAWKGGALAFHGTAPMQHPWLAVLLILGWMLQGFSEELTFRGWLMMSAGTYHKPWTAVLTSALCFAAAHLGNNGISIAACINLTLFGIAMSLLVLRTERIWMAAALHAAWNWAQGNLFGLQVSGIEPGESLLQFSQTGTAAWLGGGSFGLEAGIGTTAVLVILILILLIIPQQQIDRTDLS